MNKLSAVIIDDEYFNRKLIGMLIAKISSAFTIDGEAENIRDGFKIINTIKPSIVFLDIKMPDGSGFDLLRQFTTIDFEVVFITGFDQYALQAFEFNALDYVLKPIDVDKFKMTLEKVETRVRAKQDHSEHLMNIAASYHPEDGIIAKIPIHYNNKVVLLGIDDIMYIHSEEGNTVFTKYPLEKFSSPKQIYDFEFILENYKQFVRINKSTFININYISNYSKGFETQLTMQDGSSIEISNAKKAEILGLLNHKLTGPFKN